MSFISQNMESNVNESDHNPSVEWSVAAVRLLQGVVYHDDNAKVWDALLRNVSPVAEFFAKIGLMLVVDEAEGLAFLRQLNEDETSPDGDSIPRLFRRTPLGYEASLLCVVLRDLFRQYEEEDVQNERCVVPQQDLLALWKAFFNKQTDEVKLNRTLLSALRKLEELKFVRLFEEEPASWEIRRILKARISLEQLDQLKTSLMMAANATLNANEKEADSDGV